MHVKPFILICRSLSLLPQPCEELPTHANFPNRVASPIFQPLTLFMSFNKPAFVLFLCTLFTHLYRLYKITLIFI